MSLKGNTNEERIVYYLLGKGLSLAGAAGLVDNLYFESGLRPDNLENGYEGALGYTDSTYTADVDSGAYTNFAHDCAGYGLAQWTYWSRKKALLDFARAAKKSIGDLEMQLGFLWKELSEGYTSLLAALKTATSVRAASDMVLTQFERPADQSEAVKAKRAAYGQTIYNKYASKGGTTMTEQELRQKIVSIAQSYLGCRESDGSHRKIIDLYNSHKPLARGYAVTYTDAWCSTFASAVAIKAGLTDIIPTECGCEKHIQLFKNLGSWVENDAYTPAPGDYIFYNWDDSGAGDCTAPADHVGIVEKVSGQTITVIEGNYSNSVGRRTITVNGRYIRGYGVPKYSSKAGPASAVPSYPETTLPSSFGEVKVGDIRDFTGSRHYANSNAVTGPECRPGPAKVTAIASGAKHPYHVIHTDGTSNVYGWVDAADIAARSTNGKTVAELAQEVIAGKWGAGEERKQRLQAAGYDYDTIQNKVNALLS